MWRPNQFRIRVVFFKHVRCVITWIVMTLLLCGNAIAEHRTGQPGIRLSPASLGKAISLQQHLLVERHDRTHSLEVVLEVDPERIDLVGLSMGKRVLSLHFDGNEVKSWRHFLLPKEVQAEDVLENLQLAFWPAEMIQKALPHGWRMEEHDMRRIFYSGDEKVVEISYSEHPHWIGIIELSNQYYEYHLTIQSVSISP